MGPEQRMPLVSNESEPVSRRFDPVSLLLAAGTLCFVAAAIWLRLGSTAAPEPPAVGSLLPPLRLLNLETSEPLFLLGLRPKLPV